MRHPVPWAAAPSSRMTPARLIVLAGVCAGLHVVKLPPALPTLQADLGVSLVQAGFLLSLVQVAGMSAGVAFGALADGLGARRSMLIGLWLLAAVSALGGATHQVVLLMALRALEGFGFLLVVLAAPSLLRQWVPPQQSGHMMALWSSYMPAAATLALLLGPWVMSAWGWPAWWWLLAGLTALMALALAAGVPAEAPATLRQPVPRLQGVWQGLLATVSRPGPWLLALAFGVYAGSWMAVIGFLPTLYAQAQWPLAWVGLLTAVAAVVNILGNVAAGRWLQRRVPPARLLATGFVAMAVCSVAAFWGSGAEARSVAGAASSTSLSAWLRYAAVLLFSALGGLIPSTLFSLAPRVAPHDGAVSTTVGWMQQGSALGQFTLPPLVAWVASQAGGWQWSWVVTLGAASTGLLLAYALSRTPLRPVGSPST